MNRQGAISLFLILAVFFLAVSCKYQQLFNQSKYTYIDKIPAAQTPVINPEIKDLNSYSSKNDISAIYNIVSDTFNKSMNYAHSDSEILQQIKSSALKPLKYNKTLRFPFAANNIIYKSNLTSVNAFMKGGQTVNDHKKTRIQRIISFIKYIYNYPPEKLLMLILAGLLALFMLILLANHIVLFFIIVILALLVMAVVHYGI